MIKTYMNNGAKYLVALSMVGFLSACGTDGNTGEDAVATGADQLVSAEVIDDISPETMLYFINTYTELNTTNAFGFQSAFGYKAVKINYMTTNQNNESVEASGLLVIPTIMESYKNALKTYAGKDFSISMICDNHGTIFKDNEAPSNVEKQDGIPNYPLAISMTGYAGFAGIYPDYIGFGTSKGSPHPYIMKKASAQASLDMIKASMKYMQDNGVVFNYQLYISGYSEGGYNAMALAQKVESDFSDRVNLMGIAPMAAPFNVEKLADYELIVKPQYNYPMVIPSFLADLAYSYSVYYNDVNASDLFVSSINTATLPVLFSGDYNATEIQDGLGLTDGYGYGTYMIDSLFSSDFLNDYTNNLNSTMRQKFEENNLDNWTPKSKIHLVHCFDDEIIPFSQSSDLNTTLSNNGANVTFTAIPSAILPGEEPFKHSDCGTTAYGVAINWFDQIRQGKI